jgi:cysteinyl-tRNA synthetase
MASKDDKKKKKGNIAPATASMPSWVRLKGSDDAADQTRNRDVNETEVEELLQARWAAKVTKDYELADQSAAALRAMKIAYHDDHKTWYTLALTTVSTTVDTNTSAGGKITKDQKKKRKSSEPETEIVDDKKVSKKKKV